MKRKMKNRFKVVVSWIAVIALVITMIPPIPASAGSKITDEYLLSRGSQQVDKVVQGGNNNEWEMNIKNDTNNVQSFKVEFKITGDFSSGYFPDVNGVPRFNLAINGNECTGVYEQTAQIGESKVLGFKFGASFKGDYRIVANLMVDDLSAGGEFIPVVNHDRENPTPVVANQKYSLPDGGSNYLVIDAKNPIILKAEVDAETDLALEDGYGSFTKIVDPTQPIILKVGKHIFETRTTYGKVGSVLFNYENYDFGTAEVKWEVPVNKFQAGVGYKFTVNYKPGTNFGKPNDSQLATVSSVNSADIKDGQKVVKGVHKFVAPGMQNFKITIENKFTNTRNQNVKRVKVLKYRVLPKSLGVARSYKGTHNSLTFGLPKGYNCNSRVSGDYIILQKKVGNKWVNLVTKNIKNLEGSSTFTANKLKGNTSYTFRFIGKVNANNGVPALYSPSNSTFVRKTAPAAKPVISSVKIYNAKTWKTKDKYIKGHWVGNTYYKGYWVKGEWRTSYKIKVTIKKSIPGMKGLIVNGDAVKGTGRTFIADGYKGGKAKGKKIKVSVRTYGNSVKVVGPYSAYKTAKIK